MNKYLGIAVAVILAGLAFAIWLHGNARFSEGKADTVAKQVVAGTKAANKAAADLEKVDQETRNMSDDDVDRDLRDLGIMRRDAGCH